MITLMRRSTLNKRSVLVLLSITRNCSSLPICVEKGIKIRERMFIGRVWIVLTIFAGVRTALGQTDTLDPGKSLVDGQTLTSAREIFELGFIAPSNSSNKYLGIWFKEIFDHPIVWVANRNIPLNTSTGLLSLTATGDLLLLDQAANATVWSTGTSNASSYPSLRLWDSGNLILTDNMSGNILWQSFDHPGNTFLPGMKIGVDIRAQLNKNLTAWKSVSDPSPGEYTYGLETRGIPEAYTWKGTSPIFRTGPWDGQRWSGRPDMASNNVLKFQFVDVKDEIYYTFEGLDKNFLGRAVINESGQLQRFVWSNSSNRWDLYWSVPSDPCDDYAICGANGHCTTNYSPICQCLQGFKPKSPKDWNLREYADGCVRMTPLNCSSDGFLHLQNVKLPVTLNASAASNMTLDECRDLCSRDCSCMAFAMIRGNMCVTWPADLMDIRSFEQGGNDLYIRLAASELDSLSGSGKKKSLAMIVIIPVLSFLLLLFVGLFLWLKRSKLVKVVNSSTSKETEPELPLYGMHSIRTATNGLSRDNIIGIGGFGLIYKGKLEDGQEVAVKRLSKDSAQGIDEFKTEALIITKLQHRNLVRLLGCCIEDEERMLIYEYMPNKSLDTFIFDESKSTLLNWTTRFDIILGIARGLLYLHQDSRLKIIHRDLKASNILLDHDLNPKISDFGIAKTFCVGQTEGSTNRVIGTCGYMSPEYAMGGHFSEKSDVYSFGVLLLEILSGKRSTSIFQADQPKNLLGQAWKLWTEGRCSELLVESSGDSYTMSKALRFFQVGLLCVQEGSEDRPSMSEVVLMLSSNSVTLHQPNRPGIYVAKSCM
ncbi:G-type lectin S-receptor-like serine/threonine-protein kinase At4g27290 [Zingiber officinale]|uniref:G-type lectin S-receptor-like serine/threonine-protein kinase At4g27290 n=1 Tax=Zingiber officinale TaxID=94328 RepID=UPI001C4BE1F3|nr:G-type lectin S-receptor-like serine/threonine-protein kinase At4g27290 [Zingiber officinale]